MCGVYLVETWWLIGAAISEIKSQSILLDAILKFVPAPDSAYDGIDLLIVNGEQVPVDLVDMSTR